MESQTRLPGSVGPACCQRCLLALHNPCSANGWFPVRCFAFPCSRAAISLFHRHSGGTFFASGDCSAVHFAPEFRAFEGLKPDIRTNFRPLSNCSKIPRTGNFGKPALLLPRFSVLLTGSTEKVAGKLGISGFHLTLCSTGPSRKRAKMRRNRENIHVISDT